jgi:hypothetical protein
MLVIIQRRYSDVVWNRESKESIEYCKWKLRDDW